MDAALTRPDWLSGVPRDPRLLWLDRNENADPELHELLAQLIAGVAGDAVAAYPDTTPLYHKLAEHLGVSPACLLLTPGSDGAIRSVFETYVGAGDVVLHTEPTFAMYPVYCRMMGARAVPIRYGVSTDGPRLDRDAVLDCIVRSRPKLVCLPNPDSPTGTVLTPEDLRTVVETAGAAGALMLVDEAYHPYYEHTLLPWIETYPHLVVARTFSKAWGLAGLRVGFAASAPPVARLLHKTRPLYQASSVAIALLDRLLDHTDAMLASVRRLNAGREYFLGEMERLGFRTIHARGNFLHVAFGDRAAAVHAALEDKVLYRRDSDDACLKGFSRFSATTTERFRPIVDCIGGVARTTV